MFTSTFLAFLEGAALAFSPCILPILPLVLASSSGSSRLRPYLIISGFVVSFTVFSLISRRVVAAVGIGQESIQFGAYLLLLFFGLFMLVPFLERLFSRLTATVSSKAQEISSGRHSEGVLGALLVGALIGLVWTPCAGPILAVALLQVIQAETGPEAVLTISAFSLGAGVPMLLIGLFGHHLANYIGRVSKHTTLVRRVMGVVVIVFALFALAGVNVGEWAVTTDVFAAADASNSDAAQNLEEPNDNSSQKTAPEIVGIEHWLNSTELSLADLKGRVVLIDFWTYSCINCIRTLPYIKTWYEKYKERGFLVIGVHSPEFEFEKNIVNVRRAIKKFGIKYPVALDNDFATWKNYKNRYWPAHYLIDRSGRVVYRHFGEGAYSETENKIRKYLGIGKERSQRAAVRVSFRQTPETYLGYARMANFAGNRQLKYDKVVLYSLPSGLEADNWALQGHWKIEKERIVAQEAGAKLRLRFSAKDVFLVLGPGRSKSVKASIVLNGNPVSKSSGDDVKDAEAEISQHRLYSLVRQSSAQEGILELTAKSSGLEAYAFTFGS